MLDLDFAFFNLMHNERRGLFSQKSFLDRIAPVFFAPRVEKMIEIPDLQARGCNITIPLGVGNLTMLEPDTQKTMAEKSNHLVNDYQLSGLAVDRRLKPVRTRLLPETTLIFGDNFIKALAAALVARMLSRRQIKKVVIVGDMDHPERFAARICDYGLPVSIQSYHPSRYEVLNYRMLYEKGYAFATSYLDPHGWNRGDLVLVFDSEDLPPLNRTDAFCLRLDNDSRGLSPQLESGLLRHGMQSSLYNLAPIVESCLWAQAGFLNDYAEHATNGLMEYNVDIDEADKFVTLQTLGDSLGLWDIFLDTPAC